MNNIPDYQTCMLPLLKIAAKKRELTLREAVDILANIFNLSEQEQKQLLPSGTKLFANRVSWAKTYLLKAGLLSSPKRGIISLTPEGTKVLTENINKIDIQFLNKFPSFQKFRNRTNSDNINDTKTLPQINLSTEEPKTPDESIAKIFKEYKSSVLDDLLEKILSSSFSFFEQLIVDLLLKLGYGGSREDAGMALGKSGDEGIDGLIKEDRLGLDVIYLQAKRWKLDSTVGRPEIQKLVGALMGKNAQKGVFITTSTFSKEAKDYAASVSSQIVLINGKELLELMWEVDLGLSTISIYPIKNLNLEYFSEN